MTKRINKGMYVSSPLLKETTEMIKDVKKHFKKVEKIERQKVKEMLKK